MVSLQTYRVTASCARKHANLVCRYTDWDFPRPPLGNLVCLFYFTREMNIRRGVSDELIALLDVFSGFTVSCVNVSEGLREPPVSPGYCAHGVDHEARLSRGLLKAHKLVVRTAICTLVTSCCGLVKLHLR